MTTDFSSSRSDDWLDANDLDPANFEPVGENYVSLVDAAINHETIFGAIGPACHANGWCVIPQQRTGKRLPAVYQCEVIKWGQYQSVRPDAELVDDWAQICWNANVAVILGQVSGGVWALDIDVTDLDLTKAVEGIAFETMGETPYRRIGNAPKEALLYRAGTPEDMPVNLSVWLGDGAGTRTQHAVEFHGDNKILTIFGRHYDTLDRFKWSGVRQPAMRGPEDVPAVTAEQIAAFKQRLEELYGIYNFQGKRLRDVVRNVSFTGEAIPDSSDVSRPRSPAIGFSWEHRRNALLLRTGAWSATNAGIVAPYVNGQRVVSLEGVQRIADLACEEVAQHADVSRDSYRQLAFAQTRAAAERIASGEWQPRGGRRFTSAAAASDTAHATKTPSAPDLPHAWLFAERSAIPSKHLRFSQTDASMAGASLLTISVSAEVVRDELKAKLRTWLKTWFEQAREQVALAENDEDFELLTTLLRTAAGSGKTYASVEIINELRIIGEPQPVLFLTPSYENALELLAHAKLLKLNVVLIEGEIRSGRVDEERKALGLAPPEIKGCHEWRKKAALAAAGISGAGLCRQAIKRTPEQIAAKQPVEYQDCEFRKKCRAHQARENVAKADLVIAVHSYVTCSMPTELKACRLVIIDEAISDRITGSSSFKLAEVVRTGRRLESMTKKELTAKIDSDTFGMDREELWSIVQPILKSGGDVAKPFVRGVSAKDGRPLKDLLERTLALLTRTAGDLEVHPEMPMPAVEHLCKRPTKTAIFEETRFWRIVKERAAWLLDDTIFEELLRETGRTMKLEDRTAKGATDRRIHHYRDGNVRLSWRAEYNFSDCHLLLLDASADVAILQRTLGNDRTIQVLETDSAMRLRAVYMPGHTFSKSSLLPRQDDSPEESIRKRTAIKRLQEALATIAAMHVGGVLVILPLPVRTLLCKGWRQPKNIGFMHFGATKGLNWASKFEAVITIGCIQPSAESVDARVAALVYDQDEQEAMIDPIGALRTEEDGGVDWIDADVTIKMRSGRLMTTRQRRPGQTLAAACYEQVRREETLQAIARIRPILRDEISTYYCLGNYLPSSIIVDEVLPCDDISKNFGSAFDLARRFGGYVGESLVDQEDGEDAARTVAYLEATLAAARAFIKVEIEGQTRWYPAFNRAAAERAVEDNGGVILSAPADVQIGRPSSWDEDRDYHAVADEEHDLDTAAVVAAREAGWESEAPHSRICVLRGVDGAVVLRSETFVVLSLFRPSDDGADNDNLADAVADGPPEAMAA